MVCPWSEKDPEAFDFAIYIYLERRKWLTSHLLGHLAVNSSEIPFVLDFVNLIKSGLSDIVSSKLSSLVINFVVNISDFVTFL